MTSNQGRTSTGQTRTAISRTRHLTRSAPVRFRALVAAAALALTGCSLDGLLKSDQLPKDVTDPAIIKTREGAMAAYRGVIVQFRRTFAGAIAFNAAFVSLAGTLADELQDGGLIRYVSLTYVGPFDRRALPDGSTDGAAGYSMLQRVRGQASQGIGLLTDYVPEQPALVGHVYALEGYAEVFLAELFCSGIPLSTLDYNGDFTLSPGLSTTQVLSHAVALFDTALALASDSTRFMDLARIGKARALLNLGDYAQAAVVVAPVADDYSYVAHYGADPGGVYVGVGVATEDQQNFVAMNMDDPAWSFSVADREGTRGLDYISSGDPRTAVQDISGFKLPIKYAVDGSSPIVVASGVEARLVEAEAALKVGNAEWLIKLNALRTDGTYDTQPNATDPSQTDTLWHAGSGGVAGLRPLEDPVDPAARVDLLFRERAFWLFLTGHRQGDLRRLIRQYGRSQDEIYPVGVYPSGPPVAGGIYGGGVYGGDVTVPIPDDERRSNPKFTGCASRGA